MDNKRLILAVLLSFSLMLGWSFVSQKMGWTPSPEEIAQQNQSTSSPSTPAGTAPSQQAAGTAPVAGANSAFTATPGQEITIKTPLYTAVFNSSGGILKSFKLANYMDSDPETGRASETEKKELISPNAAMQAPLGIIINKRPSWIEGENAAQWGYEGENEITINEGQNSITLHGQIGGVDIERVYTFHADNYVIDENTRFSSPSPQLIDFSLQLGTGSLADAGGYMNSTFMARQQDGSFEQSDKLKDLAKGMDLGSGISWAGSMGKYFLAAVIPSDKSMNLKNLYQNDVFLTILEKNQTQLGGGIDLNISNNYYFGPKRVADLENAPGGVITSLDYGWFGWIAAPLLSFLKFIHSYVSNWGMAIIVLTIIIKLVLWPLSYKSYKSMEGMRKVQPLMQKIREKYKDDKQRQNQEVMQLYKTYKINPAGGCLPILVQLPIFLGLYRALLYSIELRHATFIPTLPFTDMVWLADLSLKDPLYITPIVMGATMFLQQKLTPTTGDPTQAKIMMFMPVVFTFLFISFPSGLVLYWLFNNVISIMQQYWQLKLKKS